MAWFETALVSNKDALPRYDALRQQFLFNKGLCPFIIGDDADLDQLLQLLQQPADGGAAVMAEAAALDVVALCKTRGFTKPRALPKKPEPVQAGFSILSNILTKEPKPHIHIGLLPLKNAWDLFAALGYGDWNGCPPAAQHVALHRHWHRHWHRHRQFQSIPAVISTDVVECYVSKPPADKAAVLQLAGEHYAYCPDIVDQGFASVPRLASSLLGATSWYFWWD